MKNEKCVQGFLFPELGTVETKPQVKKSPVEELKEQIRKLKEENKANLQKVAELQKENERLKKKAEAFDEFMQSASVFSTGIIAKNFGLAAKGLNAYLAQKKIQFRNARGVWELYAKYQNRGYTSYCWYDYAKTESGDALSKAHMYWTAKGMNFIRELLLADGKIKE